MKKRSIEGRFVADSLQNHSQPGEEPRALFQRLRLGKMTSIQAGANRDLGNAAYSDKRAAYAQSGFAIIRRIGPRPCRMDARAHRLAPDADGDSSNIDPASRPTGLAQ
jgi:hypothetical protein